MSHARTNLSINPGGASRKPFLAVTQVTDDCQSVMFVSDITSDQLFKLGHELKAIEDRKAKVDQARALMGGGLTA